MKNILLYILFTHLIYSTILPEKLFYSVKFKNIGAGEATIQTNQSQTDTSELDISFNLKTKKIVDLFFKLRENIHIKVDKNFFFLNYLNKKSNKRDYKKEHLANFDYSNKIVQYNGGQVSLLNKTYDPLSIIY